MPQEHARDPDRDDLLQAEELGRQGLDLLLERIATRDEPPPTRRTLPVRLIERQSVRDLGRTSNLLGR